MKPGVALGGSLSFLNLGDLLQLFGSNGSSGILRISSQYTLEPGAIFFQKGNPIDAIALEKKGLDALFALFGWVDGDFEFNPEDLSDTPQVIKKGRMEIILDGLSMLDDGEIEKVGPAAADEKAGADEAPGTGPLVRGPLIDYMYIVDEEEYADGQEIVTENSHGNWIWVVVQGTVQIAKETPQGRLDILRIGEGAFIGSFRSFLMDGNIRSSTNYALGPLQLGVLDTQRLFTEYSGVSNEFQKVMHSLDRRVREVTQRVVDIHLGQFNAEALLKDKKPFMEQGKGDEKLHLIEEGEAVVVRSTKSGPLPLVKISEGDFFGTVPFLDLGHEPNSASIFATENLKTITLDTDQLSAEYERLSATYKKMIEHMANCTSATGMVVQSKLKKSQAK